MMEQFVRSISAILNNHAAYLRTGDIRYAWGIADYQVEIEQYLLPELLTKGAAYERQEHQTCFPGTHQGPLNQAVRTEGQQYDAGVPGGAPAKTEE